MPLFFLDYYPVQEYGLKNNVGSVGASFLTCLKDAM